MKKLWLVGISLVVVVAGCGSSGTSAGGATPTPSITPSISVIPSMASPTAGTPQPASCDSSATNAGRLHCYKLALAPLETSHGSPLPDAVHADCSRLKQAFGNGIPLIAPKSNLPRWHISDALYRAVYGLLVGKPAGCAMLPNYKPPLSRAGAAGLIRQAQNALTKLVNAST